jgi:hypothetical protein
MLLPISPHVARRLGAMFDEVDLRTLGRMPCMASVVGAYGTVYLHRAVLFQPDFCVLCALVFLVPTTDVLRQPECIPLFLGGLMRLMRGTRRKLGRSVMIPSSGGLKQSQNFVSGAHFEPEGPKLGVCEHCKVCLECDLLILQITKHLT